MILDNVFYVGFCVFIIGLILGSFYNVVIIRLLNNESLILPPSKCPKCNNYLKWWHNIPLISFFILKGKCYFCNEQIDIQYPIVELISAFIFLISYLKFGLTVKMLLCALCLSLFLILAGMDIKKKVISIRIAVILLICSLIFNFSNILSSISGAVMMFCFMWTVRYIFNTLFKKETIGSGDIYVITSLGAFLGEKYLFVGLILTLIFQFIYSFPSFFKDIIDKKRYNILFLGCWFLVCYSMLFFAKIYVIHLSLLLKILIFVNLFVVIIPISKYLFNELKNIKKTNIEPLSPSVFLSVLISTLFI